MNDDLLRRLAKRLAPSNPESVMETLRSEPALQGDLGWLARILDAGDQLPMPPVPPAVSAALHDLMPSASPIRTEHAATIHDSRTAGELVGARGENTSGEAWTVVVTAASADVVVDGELCADGTTEVNGHVLVRDGEPRSFHVGAPGSGVAETRSDDSGQFSLGPLQSGEYELSARCPDFSISWSMRIGVR